MASQGTWFQGSNYRPDPPPPRPLSSDHRDNPPAAMTMAVDQSDSRLSEPDQDQHQESRWRTEVLDLLKQLVQVQTDAAKGQAQVVQLLGALEAQGSQQILDLQNVARHQSLLVENHQALLLQASRIAGHLQEAPKKTVASK
ncbi:uncharacterized protein V6R79_000691 [Siganus canaliculatus]